MNVSRLKTSAGVIETIDAGSGEAAVLLLHGNSGHKEVFARQVEELSPRYRVVVPDLLGHGGSEDAAEPGRDYTLAGHAGYLAELVTTLELGPMVVVGLSLGGHIGLELAAQSPRARGLLLAGAPPFAKTEASIGKAWAEDPVVLLSGKAELSAYDAEQFVLRQQVGDAAATKALLAAVARTDGRSRTTVVGALLNEAAADQRQLVERLDMPIAVVNGSVDQIVNLGFIEAAPYRRLWRGQPFRIVGAGHMPQVSHPEAFNALLAAFIADCVAA